MTEEYKERYYKNQYQKQNLYSKDQQELQKGEKDHQHHLIGNNSIETISVFEDIPNSTITNEKDHKNITYSMHINTNITTTIIDHNTNTTTTNDKLTNINNKLINNKVKDKVSNPLLLLKSLPSQLSLLYNILLYYDILFRYTLKSHWKDIIDTIFNRSKVKINNENTSYQNYYMLDKSLLLCYNSYYNIHKENKLSIIEYKIHKEFCKSLSIKKIKVNYEFLFLNDLSKVINTALNVYITQSIDKEYNYSNLNEQQTSSSNCTSNNNNNNDNRFKRYKILYFSCSHCGNYYLYDEKLLQLFINKNKISKNKFLFEYYKDEYNITNVIDINRMDNDEITSDDSSDLLFTIDDNGCENITTSGDDNNSLDDKYGYNESIIHNKYNHRECIASKLSLLQKFIMIYTCLCCFTDNISTPTTTNTTTRTKKTTTTTTTTAATNSDNCTMNTTFTASNIAYFNNSFNDMNNTIIYFNYE
jgi:hypothetical protein